MAEELTIDRKVELAIQASALAVEELDPFCRKLGLELDQLTGWSTAYETGGSLGVRALAEPWRPGRNEVKEWREQFRVALKVFRPRQLRLRDDNNWFTVEEVKELTTSSIVHTPVFQLRVILDEGAPRWFLYWRRAGGSWWPYAGKASFTAIDEAVAEVKADPHRCFRLHPMS
jgi:hypothetical protein